MLLLLGGVSSARMRSANFKLKVFALANKFRVIFETVHEFALDYRLGPRSTRRLLSFGAQILELKSLQVNFFEALHFWILNSTSESSLG